MESDLICAYDLIFFGVLLCENLFIILFQNNFNNYLKKYY